MKMIDNAEAAIAVLRDRCTCEASSCQEVGSADASACDVLPGAGGEVASERVTARRDIGVKKHDA